jgi:predicted enzyme involved in methoxymalonyl-ACP biosynthesis
MTTSLYWLPNADTTWRSELDNLQAEFAWHRLIRLANFRLDFLETNRLDRVASRLLPKCTDTPSAPKPARLAVLSSCTATHLLPGLRIAALRRGIVLETYLAEYGRCEQELLDPESELARFGPTAILMIVDARHALTRPAVFQDLGSANGHIDFVAERLGGLWRLARERFGAHVIQQAILPAFPPLLGNNEHRLPFSPRRLVERLNSTIRHLADQIGADVLSVDSSATDLGIAAWHDPVLWHRAKQEIHLTAAPLYGDLVARLIAAKQGRSAKCLILDLDNTLWGGVIGDDG